MIYASRDEAIAASYHVEVLDGVECYVEAVEGGYQVVAEGDQSVEWAN
jgi:hypothetical protein